ncbi:MAG TPA: ferredoxin--NADP reductase [Jatrophihabitans sp.]|nr:ferredoxin--NADP reductase [Jatrophihabitans sp.]
MADRVVVREIVQETADACSVVLSPPPGADFSYRPGQFLTLRLPVPGGLVGRSYSLCSSPYLDEPLRIAVKRVTGGVASNWINEALTVGAELECLPPAGVFTPKSLDDDLLLFAGGSGITPVLSIVKSALAAGTGRLVLVYANQHEGSVIFGGQLRELAERYPERLHVLHWLESVQGLPTRPLLRALIEPYRAYTAFLCGPSPFMETVTHALRDCGVPPARIHIERFRSLTKDPFTTPAEPEPVPSDVGGAPTHLVVELDGETYELDWPRQAKLLDFLLAQGVKAPYSCRQGQCSACACILDEGEVRMLHNEILEPEDLDEGYVLGCQSVPLTDKVKIRYS